MVPAAHTVIHQDGALHMFNSAKGVCPIITLQEGARNI